MSKTILEEAEEIIASRTQGYGTPVESWEHIAELWSVLLGKTITAAEALSCMMALKLLREQHAHKRDNLVDLCGYAHIKQMLEDGKR